MAKNVFEKVENKEGLILPAITIISYCIPESSFQHLLLGNPTGGSYNVFVT